MTVYSIGIGIADVTDPAIGQNMQGMADPSQKITGVESRLYSRAFIIADNESNQRVVLLSADLWAGTEAVKTEVIERLKSDFQSLYTENNVLMSCTHNHSGAGGFSYSKLYEEVPEGFDPHTFECIVSGMVASIQKAHKNIAPGKIYINKGAIADCGRQRSVNAYLNNPSSERAKYGHDTDKEMVLLKFVRLNGSSETPIGILNWYAIHPTDRGQSTTLINGDNKGYASYLFEREMGTDYAAQETFVAAFANSNCGDVSGNPEYGGPPDGIHDKEHMELNGKRQFEKARELFDTATEELDGNIDYRHARIDMSQVEIEGQPGNRTWPGAVGLAFTAASREDSIPRVKLDVLGVDLGVQDSFLLREGLPSNSLNVAEEAALNVIRGGFNLQFGIKADVPGHSPKAIVYATGLGNPPLTPNILPLQIIKIGTLVLTGIPGEICTMAGRRLRDTVLDELKDFGIQHLALAAYANDYSLYITTKEEYEKQHYEGGATLFGPYTLLAYQQEFRKLANALKTGSSIEPGPNPSQRSAPDANRITVRNLSSEEVYLDFYNWNDWVAEPNIFGIKGVALASLGGLRIAKHSEYAFVIPNQVKMRINGRNELVYNIDIHSLVTITEDVRGVVSSYTPPPIE